MTLATRVRYTTGSMIMLLAALGAASVITG